MPLPEKIQNAPELWLGQDLFYNGFLDLASSRTMGLTQGPISLLSVLEYCILMEIEGDQRDEFIWMMPQLDNKYLEWSRRKSGKPTGIQSPH